MTKAIKKSGMDFTKGKLFNKFVIFAIPIILTNILQQFFTAADAIVIGRFAGLNSLASVTATNPIVNLTINSLLGLAVGVNVVVAQLLGQKKEEKTGRAVHTAMLFAFIVGIIMGVLCFIFSGLFVKLLNVSDAIFETTKLYLSVYFIGTPAVVVYNFGASVLRAKGDSKRPLVFLFISGLVNVGLNLIFVICFHMDVLGVAVATVVSQILSAILVVTCMTREEDSTKLDLRKLRFYKSELLSILATGIPSMINGVIFSISNLIIHIGVNGFNEIATAGNGIASNVENFTYVAMNALYSTTITVVGQNYGANDFDRIKRSIGIGVLVVTIVGAVMGVASYLLRVQLCSLFASNESSAALEIAYLRMGFISLTYFTCGIQEVFVGTIRGLGFTTLSTIVSMIFACLFRVVWIYTVFAFYKTLESLFVVYPISWTLLIIAQGILTLYLYKKLKKRASA